MVGHIAYGQLHVTEYVFPDVPNILVRRISQYRFYGSRNTSTHLPVIKYLTVKCVISVEFMAMAYDLRSGANLFIYLS